MPLDLPDIAGQLGKGRSLLAAGPSLTPRQFKIPGFDLESAPVFAPPPQLTPAPTFGRAMSYPSSDRPAGGAVPTLSGPGIALPARFQSTHMTDNLGWPAVDLMGKPGTPVRTPLPGTIVRHGSAQGGEALYLDTNRDGQGDYWLGHVTNMLPVGARVRAGQVIAAVANQSVSAPHAHWARR